MFGYGKCPSASSDLLGGTGFLWMEVFTPSPCRSSSGWRAEPHSNEAKDCEQEAEPWIPGPWLTCRYLHHKVPPPHRGAALSNGFSKQFAVG